MTIGQPPIDEIFSDRFQPSPEAKWVRKLATGGGFTCILGDDRVVRCAGDNGLGQLGDDTTTSRPSFAPIASPAGITFKTIGAGRDHACAITTTGEVYCWGRNASGQIGDGTQTQKNTPVTVSTPDGVKFTQVAGGFDFTCALTTSATAYCWGQGARGQLGDGTNTRNQPNPVAVVMPEGVRFATLSAWDQHACALAESGDLYCWGSNANGRLGDSTTTDRNTPVRVAAPEGVTFSDIATGDRHSCAIATSGAAYCWGNGENGRRGDGLSTITQSTPVLVDAPAGTSFTRLIGAFARGCALTTAGDAYCWGINNNGQIGDGTTFNRFRPVLVQAPEGVAFASLSGGSGFTCGATPSDAVYCWGSNSLGQFGNGTNEGSLTPVPAGQ